MEYDFRSAVTTLYRQSPNAFSVTAEDPVMAPRLLRISRILTLSDSNFMGAKCQASDAKSIGNALRRHLRPDAD